MEDRELKNKRLKDKRIVKESDLKECTFCGKPRTPNLVPLNNGELDSCIRDFILKYRDVTFDDPSSPCRLADYICEKFGRREVSREELFDIMLGINVPNNMVRASTLSDMKKYINDLIDAISTLISEKG